MNPYTLLVVGLSLAGAVGAGTAAATTVRVLLSRKPHLGLQVPFRVPGGRWVTAGRMARPEPARVSGRAPPAVVLERSWNWLEATVRDAGQPLGWGAGVWLAVGAGFGALVGVALGLEFGWWGLTPWLVLAGPVVVLWLLSRDAAQNRRLRQAELVRMIEGLQVLLQSGRDLYSALRHLTPLADLLRPAWERLLARWGQSPMRALEAFREEAQVEDADILVAVLQHAVAVGTDPARVFLAQEASKLERMQQERVEELLRTRPDTVRFALIFPLVAVVTLFLFPSLYRLVEQINQL